MPEKFQLLGSLPRDTTVIEASAGTGKTYAITALAVRYVAAGLHTLDEILMITFSRAATNELRSRVQQRFADTEKALAVWLGDGTAPTDTLDLELTKGSREQVTRRHQLISAAFAQLEAATITTTHEFCSRMLAQLGPLADHDRFSQLIDPGHLVDDILHDNYLQSFSHQSRPALPLRQASKLNAQALAQIATPLTPVEPRGSLASWVAFAERSRELYLQRKRQLGVHTFDDLTSRLLEALREPDTGELAAQQLADRYRLVLVDEFQDTDPEQWEIVQRAFVNRSTVVLVGDPKQSIYAFRGADVFAYLAAAEQASHPATLPTNWRSDPAVVRGIEHLMRGVAMGSGRIFAEPVGVSRTGSRLKPAISPAVAVRCHDAPAKPIEVSAARRAVRADLVAQVRLLLDARTTITAAEGERLLTPSDVAVLTRSNSNGQAICDQLNAAGVAAVFTGASSVFKSPAANAWRDMLLAVADPRPANLARAALTPLIGWCFDDLAAAHHDTTAARERGRTLDELAVQVRTASWILADQGIAAMFEALNHRNNLYARLLGADGGERLLTDIKHLAQLLVRAETAGRDAASLVTWLDEHIAGAADDDADLASRRIETDRDAVQVMTVHRAKGLEFPVVMLSDAADVYVPDRPKDNAPVVIHTNGRRVLHVYQDRKDPATRQNRDEAIDEELRLLYVAMTRAQCLLMLWWSPSRNTRCSPLQRLLFGELGDGSVLPSEVEVTRSPREVSWIDPSLVSVTSMTQDTATGRAHSVPGPSSADETDPPPELRSRDFERRIDSGWRRTSYSSLTSEAHGWAEPGVNGIQHEVDEPVEDSADDDSPLEDDTTASVVSLSPLSGLPGGVSFGSLVHSVLENLSTGGDLGASITSQVHRALAMMPIDQVAPDDLINGLHRVMHTDLAPLAPGLTLADIDDRDRLAELDFELPLANLTSSKHSPGALADIAMVLAEQSTGAGGSNDPFGARYAQHLIDSPVHGKTLNGFLTGSVDAVIRFQEGGVTRYGVIDYKTNRIPVPDGELLSVEHYSRAAMEDAMITSHYPLQALLYSVALHRQLMLRLPGYDPAQHLAGIGYLFVRGMNGPDTPHTTGGRCGVFGWRPTAEVVQRVSDVLSGTTDRQNHTTGGPR